MLLLLAGDSNGGVSVRSKLVSYHEVASLSDSKCVNTVTSAMHDECPLLYFPVADDRVGLSIYGTSA